MSGFDTQQQPSAPHFGKAQKPVFHTFVRLPHSGLVKYTAALLLLAFTSTASMSPEITYPENAAFKLVDGLRFYSEITRQPWREAEDLLEGFDWSLPPAVPPASNAFVKGFFGSNPRTFPGCLLGVVDLTWRELEPEEGRYDFSPIERRMAQLQAKGHAAVELHIRGSVREVEYDDVQGRPLPPEKLTQQQQRVRQHDSSAPLWLDRYQIPTTRGQSQSGTQEHLINFDIFHPDYHQRYLKMVAAFGRTGIAQRKEVAVAYVHMVSDTRGEENDGAFPTDSNHPKMVERLKAWAKAFGTNKGKLLFTGHHPENLRIAYALGVGQRNGYVERYLLHTYNPSLGQSMDPESYLVVDEALPPIAENRAFGDENEEYDIRSETHVILFGPRAIWPHRYREATLRQLQMRRNYAWEPTLSPDPYLTAYLANELGRQIHDAPDAWCYLRESYVHERNEWKGKVVPVKNFERWLYQRDAPGYETRPVHKVEFPEPTEGFVRNVYAKGYNYDYVAREGKRFGFAVDDRFLSGPKKSVALKITYYDDKPWKLLCKSAAGTVERMVPCRGDGVLRTATFFLPDASFIERNFDYDFEIHALRDTATLRFVRVVRHQPVVASDPRP